MTGTEHSTTSGSNEEEEYLLLCILYSDLKVSVIMEVSLHWIRVERFHDELDYIWQKILDECRRFSSKTSTVIFCSERNVF